MKTILLTVVVALVSVHRVSAQGVFELANHSSMADVNAPLYDWTGALLSGPDWRVELYGGAKSDSLSPTVAFGLNTRVVVSLYRPGYFPGPGVVVPSVRPFDWAWLQVKVWNAQLGADYESAVARGLGGYGESALFSAQGRDPLVEPPDLPGPLLGLQSFSVSQLVPEPGVWTLLLVGGTSLWLVCRRR